MWAMEMRLPLQLAGVWAAVSFEIACSEEGCDALLAIY
jgi:hypothetical protein